MRNVKAVSLILAAVLLLGGCAHKNPDAIIVDISVRNYDDSSLAIIRGSLSEWESEHPGVQIEERDRIRNADFNSLGRMGSDHLPDVFITDCLTGRLLAREGLVSDVSEYAGEVSEFSYFEGVYAFPVLNESLSIVVYDPEAWNEGETIGFSYDNSYTIVNCILGSILGDDWGQDWLEHMIAGDQQASFTDNEFLMRMDAFKDMADRMTLYDSESEIFDSFVNEQCHAVGVSGDALYRLLDRVKEFNPSLYERLEFIPCVNDYLPADYCYGVFIRAGVDAERYEDCLSIALCLSDTSAVNDETMIRLNEAIENSSWVRTLTNCFVWGFWERANEECFHRFMAGDITSEECAFALQNFYEQYYTEYT